MEGTASACVIRICNLRFCWNLVWAISFRTSPRPFHSWRSFVLRCWGAKIGPDCHIYPKAKVWAPWNLVCEDQVTIADGAVIYNPARVFLGSHAIISQDGFICGATHDYQDATFPLVVLPVTVEAYAWVCARASVQPGVRMGEGSVLGLAAVATRDLEPWSVYGGVPARRIKSRSNKPKPQDEIRRSSANVSRG
jgi:putative colanic acid biosynthesis acetyltransferase WcaF